MTLKEYQEYCLRTSSKKRDDNSDILISALGLSGESGEVADLLKKVFGHGHQLDIERLKSELGDCLFYIADLCSKYNLSLEEVATYNIEKLKKRYPDGFSPEKSINRSPDDK